MAYTLQQLSDLEDIRTLKHRYFRGIDTADLSLLQSLFTADIGVDYRGGTYRVQLEGRDNMIEFLANSFHSGAVAMHHGHMPEITLTGDDMAEGIWYLEDIFINLEMRSHTIGSAIYRDQYRREDGQWKIARTEYDRVFEMIRPLTADAQITSHYLAKAGRKPEERSDIGHLIQWEAA
ncbi:nuclear transport factor 2 family protein [Sphingobium sp. CAP-1]|uniref:nuclear transport factor 2 family protein n=1 Tax=Sphingobium sp. CAP-1 TaxID=2676077 RepID=UPI0012BB277A|nr:nuclear transport factor 2 family protein [Sphingobium sp. CAP-1]QGP80527.1 nuclear transport factor 2 family protein [Sphingobium sp. CAP-1]